MLHHGIVRDQDHLAIGVVLVHREGRNDADSVADRKILYLGAYCIDRAGGFIAEAGRIGDRLDVIVLPKAIEAFRLMAEGFLVGQT